MSVDDNVTRVKVSNGCCYDTDLPLKVGDYVQVPFGNYDPTMVVVRVEEVPSTAYSGYCKRVHKLWTSKNQRNQVKQVQEHLKREKELLSAIREQERDRVR